MFTRALFLATFALAACTTAPAPPVQEAPVKAEPPVAAPLQVGGSGSYWRAGISERIRFAVESRAGAAVTVWKPPELLLQ